MDIALPTVAIVTPSLNQGAFIADAIESVVKQDYPQIEYLVVDGGSNDGTLDVLRRYGDRVRWISQPDDGQSDAINKGFRLTSGAILAWLNADDRYLPGAVTRAVDHLRSNPDQGLVYGQAEFIDRAGKSTGACAHVEPFDARRLLHYLNFIVQPAAFFTRQAFMAVGGLDTALHYCMDYDLWLRLAQRFKVGYLPHPLAQVRVYQATKTASGGLERLEEIERMVKHYGRPMLPVEFYHEMYVARRAAVLRALREPHWGIAAYHVRHGMFYAGAYALRRLYYGPQW